MTLDLPSVGFATLGDAGDKVSTRLGPLKLTAWKREIQVSPRKNKKIKSLAWLSYAWSGS